MKKNPSFEALRRQKISKSLLGNTRTLGFVSPIKELTCQVCLTVFLGKTKTKYCRNCKREIRKQTALKCYYKNREKYLIYSRLYSKKNKDKKTVYGRKYGILNRLKKAEYIRNKSKTDLGYKLARALRTRMRKAILNGEKRGSFVRDLGCSIKELKFYLEGQFQDGMTWDTWTRIDLHEKAWNIDHKVPLAFFDLTDREQFLKACH